MKERSQSQSLPPCRNASPYYKRKQNESTSPQQNKRLWALLIESPTLSLFVPPPSLNASLTTGTSSISFPSSVMRCNNHHQCNKKGDPLSKRRTTSLSNRPKRSFTRLTPALPPSLIRFA